MAEFFRQFAFIGAVLGGFSLAFFGTLLDAGRDHRAIGPAAALALASSSCFLIVTLGNTFAASVVSDNAAHIASSVVSDNAVRIAMSTGITREQGPLSMLFLLGVLLLLASFGAAGWIRSRRLGVTTTTIAMLTLIGVVWVMGPFLRVQ
ncbi:MAG TPA: hypothetical protein VII66_05250 [Gemmatimonadaceae bacterium]